LNAGQEDLASWSASIGDVEVALLVPISFVRAYGQLPLPLLVLELLGRPLSAVVSAVAVVVVLVSVSAFVDIVAVNFWWVVVLCSFKIYVDWTNGWMSVCLVSQ